MQNTSTQNNYQAGEKEITNKMDAFFNQFSIGTIANRCGITKTKGASPSELLYCVFALPFLGLNLYRFFSTKKEHHFGKDAVYDFLRSANSSWRRLLLLLAYQVYSFFKSLTSEDRETVLIIDDSTIHRPRSSKVELLSKVFDHTTGRFLKGFRLFSLCWSDGSSLLPLDFAILSSSKKTNRYQEVTKKLDPRTCGAKRRQEATSKATDLIPSMLKRALASGIKAKYLLMDSWFGMPAIISKAVEYLPVICMVKRTPKILYSYGNSKLTLDGIYRRLKKRRGRAKILASTLVTLKDGPQARIVFVRNRRKKDWLAILCTDTTLSEEDVVRIYGKRWDIEVFFRTVKQHLDLEKGCQARDFDALISHTSIVMLRYIFLALEQRRHDDPRSLGLLFHACCKEIRDIDYLEAFKRIIALVIQNISEGFNESAQSLEKFTSEFLRQALNIFGLQYQNNNIIKVSALAD